MLSGLLLVPDMIETDRIPNQGGVGHFAEYPVSALALPLAGLWLALPSSPGGVREALVHLGGFGCIRVPSGGSRWTLRCTALPAGPGHGLCPGPRSGAVSTRSTKHC